MNPLPHDSDSFAHDLCSDDCEALQALCDAGFDCSRVPHVMRVRAERVAAVLGLLDAAADAPELIDGVLIDVTCAQIARVRRQNDLELSPRDEDALESLVNAGMNPARCPSGMRGRAAHQAAILSLLDTGLAPSDADRTRLVGATLNHVQSASDAESVRMSIVERPARIAFKPRWADLMTVAALVLISFGVLTPMLGAMRTNAQKTACEGNLSAAGMGFGSYAQDNRDTLPMATDSPAGSPWWFVGTPSQSNSANLYRLVRVGYVRPESFACKGNAAACREIPNPNASDWKTLDQVAYSYQNLFAAERPKWTTPQQFVVLADRSPVIPRAMRREVIDPVENSPNHAGTGQTALFNDNSARWLKTPVLANGDNIWLPRVLEEAIARLQNPRQAAPLHGTETPVGSDDVFLGP